MLLAFTNGKLLTDAGIESHRTLLVRNGRIEAITGARELAGIDRTIDLGGKLLAPGFIDVQVNGGGGVLFNDDPSVASIAAIGQAHRRFGTTGFLPTLISDDLDVVARAIEATRAAIESRRARACSASTSKGHFSTRSAAAYTTPASCAAWMRPRSNYSARRTAGSRW